MNDRHVFRPGDAPLRIAPHKHVVALRTGGDQLLGAARPKAFHILPGRGNGVISVAQIKKLMFTYRFGLQDREELTVFVGQ